MSQREDTPPTDPTYGVHLLKDTVKSLLQQVFAQTIENYSFTALPSGQSYNNRIYFVSCGAPPIEYVLKVNGRFFGAAKVENEVGSLLLLNRFCPDTLVTRVIASSNGLGNVIRYGPEGGVLSRNTRDLSTHEETPGWILMTRVPGVPLDPRKLSTSEDVASLATQLSKIAWSWRRNIPQFEYAGNCNFQPHSDDKSGSSMYRAEIAAGLPNMFIYGLQGVGDGNVGPTRGLLDYWTANLDLLIKELLTNDEWAHNRQALVPLLRDFISDVLPRLSIFRHESDLPEFTFTHTDFYPRNVLVAEDNITHITGIVDFEFSGFYPRFQEFLPSVLGFQPGEGWPDKLLTQILRDLEGRGEKTPLEGKNSKHWIELKELARIETLVVPWKLAGQGDEALDGARKEVEEAVAILRRHVEDNSVPMLPHQGK